MPWLHHRRELKKAAEACLTTLLDGLLPRHCVLCGLASGPQNLCAPCAAELPRVGHACLKCGLPLEYECDRFCGSCLRAMPCWDDAVAALLYRFPIDQLVRRFKFARDLSCGLTLAREMSLAVKRKCGELPDCIIPVPLHRNRHFFRAFNQAELLATQLGKRINLPVQRRVLRRTRHTRAQSGLDAAGRKRNMKGAFDCRPLEAGFKHVAVVDDVMTTGTTLAECTRVLRRAGAGKISAWVAARAPPSSNP